MLSGDALNVTAKLEMGANGLDAKELKLSDGPLVLKGNATASLAHGGHFDGAVEGSVACGKLAGSVVAARLGGDTNPLAEALASHAVSGDVGVKLHVTIDAPDFRPHFDPTVDVRCGLGL